MLTKINSDGTWSCRGVNLEEVSGNLYVALCKLRDYEKSGFEPDDLDRVKENIHIGSNINGYIVFAVWNNCCLAENENPDAEYPYAIFDIAQDGFTVQCKYYWDIREETERAFFFGCIGKKIQKTEYWKR